MTLSELETIRARVYEDNFMGVVGDRRDLLQLVDHLLERMGAVSINLGRAEAALREAMAAESSSRLAGVWPRL